MVRLGQPFSKATTHALYSGIIRLWIVPRLGSYRLDSVRPITIAEWLAGLRKAGLSASRIRTAYRIVSQVMQSAADNDKIALTPCRGVKLPRLPETESHILTDDEVKKLIDATAAPYDLLVKLLAYAGFRIGEAFALRRADVHLDDGLLLIDEVVSERSGTPRSHIRSAPLPFPLTWSGSCARTWTPRWARALTRCCLSGRGAVCFVTTRGVARTSTRRWTGRA